MSLVLSRRLALRLGGAALLSAWLPPISPPPWLPLRSGPDGAELTIPPDMLSALAPGGCDQWALCRHFQAPALVLFPAFDMECIHRLVDRLFVPPPETHALLMALLLAEAREVEVASVVLAPDLSAHAGLSDRVDLVPFADHLVLRAPGRA